MLTLRLPDHPALRYALSALLGVLGVACFAPLEAFWLAPLVWGGLYLLLQQARDGRQSCALAYVFGLAFFLTGVSWVFVSLSVFGGMPAWLAATATLLFCAAMALYPALAGALFKRFAPMHGWRSALAFALLIATVDWLRGWFLTGFPWLTVGYSQTPPSPLAGFAPLVGVHGLSVLVAFCGVLLFTSRRAWLIILLLCGLGQGLRQVAWTAPDGEPISVALIQGNIPQEMKFRPEAFFQSLDLFARLMAANPAQLTLLPETAFPVFIDQMPPDYLETFSGLARRTGGDLIAGTLTGNPRHYFNSALSLGSAPTQIYSKQHLVPFGEFIPPGFAWFMAQANIPASSFSRGPAQQAPLQVAGRSVAVDICYEDVFGDEIIRPLPAAGILANLSNTAWFGDSLAQPQHLQIARLRALETGRPMLRATNTGMTAIIRHDGSIQAALPAFTTAVLKGEVQARQGRTPYVIWGDLAFIALLLLGLILVRGPTPLNGTPKQD